MEHNLTCNNLQCRRELADRALVTTCSHIFCLECAHQFGVTGQPSSRRPSCPACKSELLNPDDAVITNLNPSEDYKTSVLSGLSPNIIMECAGRALSFWAYQTTQDICYQQYLYKTLSEKYSNLHVHSEKSVNDAHSEIEKLQNKLNVMASEQESFRRKYEDLAQAYKDKNRKLLQTQELYDKVKRKVEIGHIQRAACDAVDSTVQNAGHPGTQGFDRSFQIHDSSYAPQASFEQGPRFDPLGSMNTGLPRVNPARSSEDSRWGRPAGAHRNGPGAESMGSSMRQRLGIPAPGVAAGLHSFGATPRPGQKTNHGMNANATEFTSQRPGLSGIGLTSGLKVSQPASIPGRDTFT